MNNSNSVYKDIYYGLKNLSRNKTPLEGLEVWKYNFSKKFKDESISIKFAGKEFNQEYNIEIVIWRKLFFSCHLFQISGHVDNQYFKAFFTVNMDNKHPRIEMFDFSDTSKCPLLSDKGHIGLHPNTNVNKKSKVGNDMKKMNHHFQEMIKQVLERKERERRNLITIPVEGVRNVEKMSEGVINVPISALKNVEKVTEKGIELPVEGIKNVRNIILTPVESKPARNITKNVFNVPTEAVKNVGYVTKNVINIPIEGLKNVKNVNRSVLEVPVEGLQNLRRSIYHNKQNRNM